MKNHITTVRQVDNLQKKKTLHMCITTTRHNTDHNLLLKFNGIKQTY